MSIRQINRVLDVVIVILIFVMFSVAAASRNKEQRRYDVSNDPARLRAVPPLSFPSTESFSADRCAQIDKIIAYFTACVGDRPRENTRSLTCPADVPEGVRQPPANRNIATALMSLYTESRKRGLCLNADETVPVEPEKREASDPN